METKKSTWEVLSKIDCNDHVEEKNGLKYLSWAWAWGIVKEHYPDASYEVIMFDNKPYLFDEKLGYMVHTRVTINGETLPMWLPVMDNNNKAMKDKPYTYKAKEYKYGRFTGNYIEKTCEAATMFDINTAIMRCLTKNIAMFGLGHYIYAGEDLPEQATEIVKQEKEQKEQIKKPISDDMLKTLLNLKDSDFPYTLNNRTFKNKKEVMDMIEKYAALTDEQLKLFNEIK